MRILLVTPAYYPSSFGGVNNFVTILSRELVKLGHEVTVYTTNAHDFKRNMDLYGEHTIESVRVVYLKNLFPRRYWHAPGVIKQIINERKKFDIVHLHNNFGYMNGVIYFMSRICKIPVVFSAHGSLTVRFRNRFVKTIYNKIITRRILNYSSRLIALNGEEKQQYLSMGAEEGKIEEIPLGIVVTDYGSAPENGTLRRRYGISTSETIVLFMGRIHFIKGIEFAIRAVKELNDEGCKVKFLIAGPDFGHLSKLERIVSELNLSDSVLFTGPLYGKEKLEAFYGSDIFVLPSVSDTFPIVALEAGYCGLPLVLTEGVLLSAKIKEKAALVAAQDSDSIAAMLKRLIYNSAERVELGRKARDIVEDNYSSDIIAKKTADVYESVLNESNLKLAKT